MVGHRGIKWIPEESSFDYLDKSDKYLIGLFCDGNNAEYCSGDDYNFITNDSLVYDNKSKMIRYYRFDNGYKWNVLVDQFVESDMKKSDMKNVMVLNNVILEEKEWFGLKSYLECI